ncbi:uncharacterized protein LOC129614474 [Condylostylus longicornis]|uniref:uncharacterized protein LOC129614474 n=1 Tax=Condylostylus longicornis TaxID=2530218 RepID=UPI00244E44B8|nr:uncharacterized protein LOC129614474 [Condylostylus longicornis]
MIGSVYKIVNGQTIYNEQNNPAVWGGACQNGTKQSPINLVINKAIYLDMNQLALNYQQYDIPLGNVTLTNDGLSVVVDFQKSQNFMPGVRYLGKQYLLDSFHFHWGGSEHEFNGKRLDGEIHLVHLSKQEEILVLGALLQKTDSSNNAISNIFRTSTQNIQNFNTTTTLDFSSTSLRDVLQNVNLLKYLTYEGSLTTPNCNEGVRWIVYRDIIQVDGQAVLFLFEAISGQTIYDEQDDSDVWPGQCQNGGMQSPINLVISKASYTNQYALYYQQYDEPIGKVQLKNDGKTGSLTTPDCDEGVRWIVYRDIIQVDAQAIEGLKQLENEKGNKILFNYRNIQPLNGRTVYKTFIGRCQTIYDEQYNPNIWPGLCQTGENQSPINIDTCQTSYLDMSLSFQNYDVSIGEIELKNDGKSIHITFLNPDFHPAVTFFETTYNLTQFHFHWGESEHAFNYIHEDAEIHLVHVNSTNNILVLGVLLRKSEFLNNIISDIFDHSVLTITDYDEESTLDLNDNLTNLLDNIDFQNFVFYEGSLTTPNCNEGVKWIVFRDVIEVNENSVENLVLMEDENGSNLLFTNRDIQPLNNRVVYRSCYQC